MPRHSFSRSSLRLLALLLLACSAINVYFFCVNSGNELFTTKFHIQVLRNFSGNASFLEARRIFRNESTTENTSIGVNASKAGSRDETSRSNIKTEPVQCKQAPANVIRDYISKLRTVVNPHHVNVTLSADQVCKGGASPYILILSVSMTSHFNVRETIRKTWASFAKKPDSHKPRIELLFVIGQANSSHERALLTEESDKYGDILQGGFREEYSLITRKVLMGMKWTLDNCRNASYLLKVDEDVFVSIPQILEVLIRQDGKSAIIGYRHATGIVFRKGNWGVTLEQFKFCSYLPYVEGNSYVISGSLVAPLFNISQYHPYMVTEDAYITGILREMIGANIFSNRRFATPAKKLRGTDKRSLSRFFNEKMISETRCSINDMKALWSVYTELNNNTHK